MKSSAVHFNERTMRYPAAETAEKHERILEEASRLFRERGFSGVSVGEIMKATGLTHGPFYNHFDSKDALMAECVQHASDATLLGMDAASADRKGMQGYVERYLSADHREAPGEGCVLAALASDATRTEAVRATFTRHINAVIERYVKYVPWPRRTARAASICTLSTLVGAMVLARAVDDESLAREILKAARTGVDVEGRPGV